MVRAFHPEQVGFSDYDVVDPVKVGAYAHNPSSPISICFKVFTFMQSAQDWDNEALAVAHLPKWYIIEAHSR